ncbi:uncharacterized protein C12orf42 homolog isoform X4 [Mus caroli]|uniref:Uncharacterized protein C12orf42 homolog isoform X4 n=1 Tax=Mus caroli TaxID=10089 RepID=A0A6P5QKH1_MUSCR|nr:uncharacterized protein C12orf42 homolog isoform X4 [Mus caroli]
MQKSFCYIPIVSSVTLWERGSPNTSKKRRFFFPQKPQQQKQQTECCFSLLHESFQPSSLHCRGYALGPASSRHHRLFCNDFVTGNQRLKLQPIPRCKTTASPCSRFLTHMKTFSSSHKTDKLHFLPFPGPAMRPFTAIGLCRSVSQSYPSQPISCKTSETVQEDKATASGSPTQTDSLTVCGSALGRGAVAITPETTLKHPHLPTERRPKAVISLPARVVKEPLPLLVGSSTRLFSKKLMKACSSVAPRPPQDFHKACSQSLSKPVVNTHTNC